MKKTSYFLFFYLALRALSFWFGPDTPLQSASVINQIVAAAIILLTAYWLIKKDERGWYIVAGEIILGGAGGMLALGGISLRTLLLFTSITIYLIQKFKSQIPNHKSQINPKFQITKYKILDTKYLILLPIAIAGLSALNGLLQGHNRGAVIADFVPYLFFLYYFPLYDLWTSPKFRDITKSMLYAAIIGNAIFILFTLIGLSGDFFHLQDAYYHWYRDVALGKITDLGSGFFRLVLNEQLLLAPLLLFFVGNIISTKKPHFGLLFASCSLLFLLSISLTRIYLLALIFGLLILFKPKKWQRWLAYSTGTIAAFILIFSATHLAATRGQSMGLELLGLRLGSITAPQIEDSALSRMLLLPKIWEKIKSAPLLGHGLGDTVTVYSPTLDATITTPHFDWGYLEIWDEMGLIGLVAWLLLIVNCSLLILRDKHKYNKRIYFALLVSILIINLTSPALFHVMGIILLIIILGPPGFKYARSAGGVIVNNITGKILVVNQQNVTWSLPKGHLDGDEDTLTAAKREITEETGLTMISFVKELGNYDRINLSYKEPCKPKPVLKNITFFYFTTDETKLKPIDPANPEAIWVEKEKVADIISHPKDKEFWLKIKDQI